MTVKFINRWLGLILSFFVLSCSKESNNLNDKDGLQEPALKVFSSEFYQSGRDAFEMQKFGTNPEVWGVTEDGRVYRYNWDLNGWYQPSPGSRLEQISVGKSGEIWGRTSDRRIYRWDWASNSWYQPNTGARCDYIDVGSFFNVYAIANSRRIYRWNYNTNYWEQPNPSARASTISTPPNEGIIYCTSSDNRIFRSYDSGLSWSQFTTGHLSSITTPYQQEILGIGYNNYIYKYNFQTSSWYQPNPGARLKQISAYAGDHWGIGVNGSSVYRNTGSGWYQPNPGASLKQISVGGF